MKIMKTTGIKRQSVEELISECAKRLRSCKNRSTVCLCRCQCNYMKCILDVIPENFISLYAAYNTEPAVLILCRACGKINYPISR